MNGADPAPGNADNGAHFGILAVRESLNDITISLRCLYFVTLKDIELGNLE
jgi:hypothetical protein